MENYLSELKSSDDLKDIIFKILNSKGDKSVISDLKEVLKDYPTSVEALNNLEEILEFVKHDNIVINFGIARGLDYYTGMVFEIYGKKEGARQVCGGGRYDNLIELFGEQPTPAVGFAYGFDRVMLNIDDFEVEDESILIIPIKKDKKLLKECLNIADVLRESGKSVEVDLMNRKLNKALNYANTVGISKVIIIGEKELSEGKVSLKNMKTGEQELVDLEDLGSI